MSSNWGESYIRRARKEHICYECGTTIYPGQKYLYSHWINDDGWFNQKTCLPCEKLLERKQQGEDLEIELSEYVYGYHTESEIVNDCELLSFVVRHSGRTLDRCWDKMIEDEDGARRAFVLSERTGQTLLNLLKAVVKKMDKESVEDRLT